MWYTPALHTSYFYPRPPRGGRHVQFVHLNGLQLISIHALREEGDATSATTRWTHLQFLSTPSARRATRHASRSQARRGISIHALREEGDLAGGAGEFLRVGFLSTPSARRATTDRRRQKPVLQISIHALREEGDFPGDHVKVRGNISIHALREEGDPPCCV